MSSRIRMSLIIKTVNTTVFVMLTSVQRHTLYQDITRSLDEEWEKLLYYGSAGQQGILKVDFSHTSSVPFVFP